MEKQENLHEITKDMATRFISSAEIDPTVIEYLKSNKDEIVQFCLQVRDSYPDNDTFTGYLKLAQLIGSILEKNS